MYGLSSTDRKQMGFLREHSAKSKMGFLRHCCNQLLMKNGRPFQKNVTAICETYKTACDRKTHTSWEAARTTILKPGYALFDGRLSPHFCQRLVANARVLSENVSRCVLSICVMRGESGMETFSLQTLRNWKMLDTSEIPATKFPMQMKC